MNIKDVEVGKYYSLKIWEDDEAIFYKCIDEEEDWFVLQECPYYGYDYDKNPEQVLPWLLYKLDEEWDSLQRIHEMQYIIRSMGLLIEKEMVEKVLDEKKKL